MPRTSATASSAAAEGVGARRSAAKSAIVVSVSCPTAEITGVLHSKIARATASSLNAQRSSMEPPPRPTIIASSPRRSRALMPFTMLSAAPWPCTRAGNRISWINGFRRRGNILDIPDRGPGGSCDNPQPSYIGGNRLLVFRGKHPHFFQLCFKARNLSYSRPAPSRVMRLA